ncbi:hypothetical protein GMA3_37 [Gordonia phage GMA3]|uniref:Uncharacterized protein n=1 Tax=Gordonia phage GMA3 TaxID=1647284 RepID=A0A0K0NKV4_9CAUD|nr:hypothetical protein AU105_gp037 [Gordonia phage GMA3]AKL88214.1 hypothetical protein GMA3_37 [Gordonia phage GMA3]
MKRLYRVKIKFNNGSTMRFSAEEFTLRSNGASATWRNTIPNLVDLDLDNITYATSRRRPIWYIMKMLGKV